MKTLTILRVSKGNKFVIVTCSHSIPFGRPIGSGSTRSYGCLIQNYNKVGNKQFRHFLIKTLQPRNTKLPREL